jgi:predicted ATP-binding protein involved in virulence
MRLTSLNLNSFRAFNTLKLPFHPRLNVLIGSNGCGKSSVLHAVSASIQRLHEDFTDKQRHAYWSPQRISQRPTRLLAEDISLSSPSTAHIVLRLEISLATGDVAKVSVDSEISLSKAPSVSFIFQHCYPEIPLDPLPLAVHFPALRWLKEASSLDTPEFEDHPLAALDHALAPKLNFKSLFQWFRFREDLEHEQRLEVDLNHRDPQLEAVRAAITQVIPGFEDHQLKVKRRTNQLVLKKCGQDLSLHQLSDGEQGLIAMVADIARRLAIANPTSPDPLSAPAVILIDEIELHLHPGWQRIILPRLLSTFTSTQFIVTTHSPAVLSEVPNADKHVWALSLDARGHAHATQVHESYGLEVNRVMEDLMDVTARPSLARQQIQNLSAAIHAPDASPADLAAARATLQQLQASIRADDPDLVRAELTLQRREATQHAAHPQAPSSPSADTKAP